MLRLLQSQIVVQLFCISGLLIFCDKILFVLIEFYFLKFDLCNLFYVNYFKVFIIYLLLVICSLRCEYALHRQLSCTVVCVFLLSKVIKLDCGKRGFDFVSANLEMK